MYKIVGAIAVGIAVYFLFFNSPGPEYITFNGKEFGPKELDRTNDSNSEIYIYKSKTVANHDYVMILYPNEGTGSLKEWSSLFSRHFESQGYQFKDDFGKKTGINGNVAVYMMPLERQNVVSMFVLEDRGNRGSLEGANVFRALEGISLE